MDQKKKVGNYLLINKIGQGQFGVVYKGVLLENQSNKFAIKCIDKKKLEGNSILNRLFQTEMSVMSKINHPNIMHLYEFMETAHNYYLVIQYCNNGDLEQYLKKMGRLSEEEAVYFLMQIMNGFRVLHQNKVMHRDVKLANIFLHNDRVVIGDFGFAKQGVNVTCTRLGTPITMAPELLNSKGGSYNSKADLWSIGVCFYQILFGKTPFDAKTYDDLKLKVKSSSGHKLRFPRDIFISDECRHLLVNLLQYEPNQRIEWRDFFNHRLFEVHEKKQKNFENINNSTLFRNHEEIVKQEFVKNKKTNYQIKLINPEKMESNSTKGFKRMKANEETIKVNEYNNIRIREHYEEAFRYIRARYCHEKKKIIFIMYTVRKLRNLAKMKNYFDNISEMFMLSACLLLQKGLLLNKNTIRTLAERFNFFELKEFDKFLQTEDNLKIQKNFKDDDKIYQTFSQQMTSKFEKEVNKIEFKSEFSRYKYIGMGDLKSLEILMENYFFYFLGKIKNFRSNQDVENKFCLAILHFYYAISSEKTFPFVKKNKIFEWKIFERKNSAENARHILKSL